jgi:DNA-binding HxlR family transcriptional regulator
VGERWTLLIIRELLSGPRRYQELLDNLPGIGTNLLAARLRELQTLSIVRKVLLSAPRIRAYELTEMGRALEPALVELARWGVTALGHPRPNDHWSAQWNPLALTARFQADKAAGIDAIYQYDVGGHVFHACIHNQSIETRSGSAPSPDVQFVTDEETFLDLASESLSVGQAVERGRLSLEGTPEAIRRSLEVFAV